jgi:2-polyprenyl-6-methoxyphenol hydroxylase-like FAD-dependent oxidoreductase
MARPHRQHAIVIGGSIAGLSAARILSDHFSQVTILERDELPTDAQARKGVPQGRHAHVLLGGGARALARLFPGIMDELVAGGAEPIEFNRGHWHQAGGYRARSLVERSVVSATRPFLEEGIRRRVAERPDVRILTGMVVETLVYGGGRVHGVRAFDGTSSRELLADLVVDCSGRGSRAPLWMEEIGYRPPEVVEVRCDVRYGTAVLRRRDGDLDGSFAVVIESPPDGKHVAFLLPVEGDRWMVTVAASFGAEAPTDPESFVSIAAGLPAPEIEQVLRKAGPVESVATHRMITSKRRRYEKLSQVPLGFLALGDAICSFNPVYGEGMSVSALQAVELGACLDEIQGDDERLARQFYQRAARIIAGPWQIAVGNDFGYPECTGRKPFGTDLRNRYLHRVLLAAQVSPEVNTAMLMVQNLLAPPASLYRPKMVRAVQAAAREAERRLADAARPDRSAGRPRLDPLSA